MPKLKWSSRRPLRIFCRRLCLDRREQYTSMTSNGTKENDHEIETDIHRAVHSWRAATAGRGRAEGSGKGGQSRRRQEGALSGQDVCGLVERRAVDERRGQGRLGRRG